MGKEHNCRCLLSPGFVEFVKMKLREVQRRGFMTAAQLLALIVEEYVANGMEPVDLNAEYLEEMTGLPYSVIALAKKALSEADLLTWERRHSVTNGVHEGYTYYRPSREALEQYVTSCDQACKQAAGTWRYEKELAR